MHVRGVLGFKGGGLFKDHVNIAFRMFFQENPSANDRKEFFYLGHDFRPDEYLYPVSFWNLLVSKAQAHAHYCLSAVLSAVNDKGYVFSAIYLIFLAAHGYESG